MQEQTHFNVIRHVTIVSASTNILLAVFKILIGFFGHSQALIADGIHSFSDLLTDGLVFFSAKVSNQGPDKNHPYGHKRIETVASIIIAGMLILVALGIAYQTFYYGIKSDAPQPHIYVIIVAVVSILANEFLYHYNIKNSYKINSDLLKMNAWHNRSDSFVSMIVLISVIGALCGAHHLDAIGAVLISILILKIAIKMMWSSIKELVDTSVEEALLQQISDHILSIPGVMAIHQLRTRSHGKNILLDVHIQVPSFISVSEGHYISESVECSLYTKFANIVDVVAHIDSENDQMDSDHCNLMPNRPTIETALNTYWSSIGCSQPVQKIILHYLNHTVAAEVYLSWDANTSVDIQRYREAVNHINYISNISVFFITH